MKVPSLRGFIKRKWLETRLEQPPLVIESPVPGLGISVKFAVHTWFEYHNRAHGSYLGEPDMVEWLKTSLRNGDVFWDVGANVGAYSILAAKLCPQADVYAFEPFIPTFAHLWENAVLNGVTDRLFAVNCGLLDQTGPERLAVNDTRAGSSQHQVGGAGGVYSQGVLSFQGAEIPGRLGLPAPNLLKLDIDGLEERAIHGLEPILANNKLRQAMIEVDGEKSEQPVQKIFERYGFRRVPNLKAIPTGSVFNALFSRE